MTNDNNDPRRITRFDPNTPANRRFREEMHRGMSGNFDHSSDQLAGLLMVASADAQRRANLGQDGMLQGLAWILKQLADVHLAAPTGRAPDMEMDSRLERALDRFIASADGVYTEYLHETKSIPMLTVVPWDAARQVLRELKKWPAVVALDIVAQRLPRS